MKKISLIIMGILIITTIATAITYNTKQEAITAFNIAKLDKDQEAITIAEGFKYVTDKTCEIEYPSGNIECQACVEFTYNTEKIKQCYPLDEDTTLEQDNARIKTNIQKDIKSHYPPEEITFVKAVRTGMVITK